MRKPDKRVSKHLADAIGRSPLQRVPDVASPPVRSSGSSGGVVKVARLDAGGRYPSAVRGHLRRRQRQFQSRSGPTSIWIESVWQ